MRNPLLYRIGIEYKCFGNLLMFVWIIYGLWHSFVIFFVCFWGLTNFVDKWSSPQYSDGQDIGFWIAGHCVYGACIFIANLTIFHR